MARSDPPPGVTVTYSQQYRRCGKAGCARCGPGQPGHGPYWYAFWRDAGRARSRYLGVQAPPEASSTSADPGGCHATTPAALRVRTLGAFIVTREDAPLPTGRWARGTVGALFKALLGAPGQRLPRARIMDLLWPDADADQAAASLRVTLHRLRALLDPPGARVSYLRAHGGALALAPAGTEPPVPDWLDADAFAHAAAAALTGRDAAASRAALAHYGGDYLPDDLDAPWALRRREELRQQYHALLLHLAGLEAGAGAAEPAISRLRTLLADDPCHEEAARLLMRLLAQTGARTAALRVYDVLARALRDDFAVTPAPATAAVRATLPATMEAAPPALPGLAPPSNLPAALTRLVGRGRALAALEHVLRQETSATRLLTLTGPGGVGKTRLALAVAAEVRPAYPDGVWLVELAALTDGARVPAMIAAALGLREAPDQPLMATLLTALRARHLLLLLDNGEHLRAACSAVAATLLPACPGLRILVTSRAALDLAGETVWRVPPLTLPPPPTTVTRARSGTEAALPLDRLARVAAIRLFLERARARRPDVALTAANAEAVVQICRRLDGLPLAIELAAAWLGALSVQELADQLGRSLPLLDGADRAVRPPQRTLRGVLDWSYHLLAPAEQTLLRRVAVFADGWTHDAAVAVCVDDGPGMGPGVRPEETLGLLARLEAASLLLRADVDGVSRYSLLETTRHYARERLAASGESARVGQAHAAYYLALAEAAEPRLGGRDQAAWLARLSVEHDNLRAALDWTLARAPDDTSGLGAPPHDTPQRDESGLRLAGALWRFWRARGYLSEGRAWLDTALDAPARRDDRTTPMPGSPARVQALIGASVLARDQGDYRRATARGEDALALSRQAEDAGGVAGALNGLGVVAHLERDLARAQELYTESLALYRALGQAPRVAAVLNNLGLVAQIAGDTARARALHEESLALKRALGDTRGIATSLHNLGAVALEQGDRERAAPLFAQSLTLKRALENTAGIAAALDGLAEVAGAGGQARRAARLMGAAAALRAALDARPKRPVSAHYNRAIAEARVALGEESFAAAWAEGEAYPLDQAIADALALAPTVPALPSE